MFARGTDGTEIFYAVFDPETELSGDPVLLVHGFASHGSLMWKDTGWLTALAGAGRRAVTVDLRGHGHSGKPSESAYYSPAMMAADLRAVLDHAGLERVDVVTYSMGGLAGWELARRSPERVGRVVLGGAGTAEVFGTLGPETVHAFFHNGLEPDDAGAAAILGMANAVTGNDPAALRACVAGMAGAGLTGGAARPVLLAAGEFDEIAAGAPELATRLGARFVPIAKRDHRTAISARVFKREALEFLKIPERS